MAETPNQEWNISQTTAPQSPTTAQPASNEWNVDQPVAAPQQSAAKPTTQQWDFEVQWDINQPAATEEGQQGTKEQWAVSQTAASQLESSPEPSTLWDVAQPEPSPKSTEPTNQQWSVDQEVVTPTSQGQKQTNVTEQSSPLSASNVTKEPVKEEVKQQPVVAQGTAIQPKPEVIPQEKPTTPQDKEAQPVVTTQPPAPQRADVQSPPKQEPGLPEQPVPPQATVHVIEPMSPKQSVAPQETVAQPSAPNQPVVATQEMVAQPVVPKQSAAPQGTVAQPTSPKQPVLATQEMVSQPVVPKQPAPPQSTTPQQPISKQSASPQETVTQPTPPRQPIVATQEMVVQPVIPKASATPPPQETAAQSPALQQPITSKATVVPPTAPKQKQAVVQQITPQKPTPQTVVQSTSQVSMQPRSSHQSVSQTTQQSSVVKTQQPMAGQPAPAQVTRPPANIPPEVKPKPSSDNQGPMGGGAGDEITLEEIQKGVFWLGPELEGWIDKTKALKEEFRRQGDANEMYFVKNLLPLDLKALNISDDPSKYVYNVIDLRGVEVVNLLRCVINEYREYEAGPFIFQFADDKKFKLELLPTSTQPGNGLMKTVGRLKYYAYRDMCQMLKTAGVNSKGLGIMLQKLNTSGLKSALHNKISPMNELHFMLLFEVAKRLVRGPHGFSMSTEPEIDHLPIGVAVSRMITMFCKGNYCLNYEAVFGTQEKYNPFVDSSVVLRRQKIYALNKLFYDAEIRSQAGDNPYMAKFLKYHNGYIIKTFNGFVEELDMAFRGF